MIPSPLRMLVAGDLAAELQSSLSELFDSHAEFRCVTEANQIDLSWANSFSGFNLPPDLDASHLQWAHCWAAGVEQWLDDKLPRNCLLTRSVGDMGYKIAEFCLAYSLAIGRGLFKVSDNQLDKNWADVSSYSLKGLQVAVLGAGAIGAEICRVYRANGAHVSGFSRSGSGSNLRLEQFSESAHATDILVACLPDTPSTQGLVDSGIFDQCQLRQFINVGRGSTVNTGALLAALSTGQVEQAVLDVFDTEPLPADSPLWHVDGLYISPHRSAPTEASDIVESIRDLLREGEKSRLIVDRTHSY
jgi:glyoxylate/hydroxypyruvate reductase A